MAYYQSSPSAGRHFLQIPGPTNVPDRVLRAMDNPTMDHRGPDFGRFGAQLLEKVKLVFKTQGPVVIYPASGTGAWEAALVNTLSPGDRVLMCETGWFAHLWEEMAERLALKAELLPTDWRRGADVARHRGGAAGRPRPRHQGGLRRPQRDQHRLHLPHRRGPRAPSTPPATRPCCWSIPSPRSARIDYRHDEWGVDVTVAGSQKGLMLPPGLSFNAVSAKALKAAETAKLTRSFWDWRPMIASNATGYFPYTPATNLLYGLDAALDMLVEEGSRTSSPGTTASPRRPAAPSGIGAWRCNARTRGTIPRR